jgi:hypothetical protein
VYEKWISDEWAPLLEDIYHWCRGKWNYLIPGNVGERHRLRAICARVLEFENHYLDIYKPFLLGELQHIEDTGNDRAVWVMRQIPFGDDEVRAAIESLGTAGC